MAWFFLDTHRPHFSRVGWLLDSGSSRVKTIRGRSQKLWTVVVKDWAKRVKTLSGICVVAGPGSFSAVRIGVLYANLLARFLKKPLVGVSVEEAKSLSRLGRDLRRHIHPTVSYVAPVYDAEPNITLPRITHNL
ncbi:MAG: hypothetical protein Q8R07_01185 [Candidatus Uhrbacteria bacterium]|nr:hypothetical protein [Candidatus Uhrbacteria bacterium]